MAEGGRNDGVIPSGSEGSRVKYSWPVSHDAVREDPSLPLGMTMLPLGIDTFFLRHPPAAVRRPPSALLPQASLGLDLRQSRTGRSSAT